jgi:hypothetical protein
MPPGMDSFSLTPFHHLGDIICLPRTCTNISISHVLSPDRSGTDLQNRSIMWIMTRPNGTPLDTEKNHARAGIVYFTALHCDLVSLRNGITFVLDTNNNDMATKRGNESKLQNFYQSIPLRPQRIYITGAGWWKRLLINAAITVASVFSSSKVLKRIRFAELDEVKTEIADANLPVEYGGNGGGIRSKEEQIEWVRRRLRSFPPLPADL